ncbi:putative neutral zinc metallopeptidase [compost metagenome]
MRFELQADYLAGVWANHVQGKGVLEEGDLDEALTAASAVGDDTLQKQARGYVVPESFTHGTSEQRKRWFYKGFQTGSIEGGDTFSANNL